MEVLSLTSYIPNPRFVMFSFEAFTYQDAANGRKMTPGRKNGGVRE